MCNHRYLFSLATIKKVNLNYKEANKLRIALLQCTSKKKFYKCPARELYSESPRFRLAYDLAKLVADKIFILSAKYGLVEEETVIEPYEETFRDKSASERAAWGERVIKGLKGHTDLEGDRFMVIAGENYRKNLLPHLTHFWLPLKGKRQGEWISELRRLIELEEESNYGKALHMLFNGLPRLNWETIGWVPYKNGIYIMFEKGERYRGMDRIVRIGTHRGRDRLLRRLKDHFIRENARGSILRKNIGRVLLNKAADPYLKVWNINWRNIANRENYGHLENVDFEAGLEREISSYLRDHITFTCFPVEEKDDRLRLEEGIIATLNRDPAFGPGPGWFGRKSPIEDIAESGLWNRHGLWGELLDNEELAWVKCLARFGNDSSEDGKGTEASAPRTVKKGEAAVKQTNARVRLTADDLRQYLDELFAEGKKKNQEYLDLVSGDIHRAMGMKNRMPQVCRIMYEKMEAGDKVLHTTPSGMSSTIKIRYFFRDRG